MKLSVRLLAAGLCIVAVCGVMAVRWWRSVDIGAGQRGADLALVH